MVRMVDGMAFAPKFVGDQGKDAADDPDAIVATARFEKGAMPAIMLDDKDAHQEASRRHRQQEGQPIADMQA